MSSNFNCSYMARSSLAYIPGFSVKFFFQPRYTDYANWAYFHKRSHLNLLFWNRWNKLNQTWQGWPLLLKIEISSNGQNCSILSQNVNWLEVGINGHNCGRGPSKNHFTKVWLQLVQWFLRRRLKCEMLTDGRRTTDDGRKMMTIAHMA